MEVEMRVLSVLIVSGMVIFGSALAKDVKDKVVRPVPAEPVKVLPKKKSRQSAKLKPWHDLTPEERTALLHEGPDNYND